MNTRALSIQFLRPYRSLSVELISVRESRLTNVFVEALQQA
jgi:hypothetical protein